MQYLKDGVYNWTCILSYRQIILQAQWQVFCAGFTNIHENEFPEKQKAIIERGVKASQPIE